MFPTAHTRSTSKVIQNHSHSLPNHHAHDSGGVLVRPVVVLLHGDHHCCCYRGRCAGGCDVHVNEACHGDPAAVVSVEGSETRVRHARTPHIFARV